MSTRASRGEPLPQDPIEDDFATTRDAHDRLSLRPRDALAGAIAMIAIASGVLIIAGMSHSGDERTVVSRMLSTVVLLFAPSILAALYSIFFERSKIYGIVDLLLSGLVILKLPFTWYWLRLYLPVACAFAVLCAAVWALEQRGRQ
jgi:hypothetical protein